MRSLAYEAVIAREMRRCARCGGAGSNWHHRRSKSVRDLHTDCTCNGVWLCGSGTTGCHGWVHSHPFMARQNGWIVSRHVSEPSEVGMMSVRHQGFVWLDCDGRATPVTEEETDA